MHLQQLKGMQRFKLLCERGTICQLKVYERGASSVKNGKRDTYDLWPTCHQYYYFTESWLKFCYVSMSLNNLCWFETKDEQT